MKNIINLYLKNYIKFNTLIQIHQINIKLKILIRCAYALNLANIKAVCYGCSNERFGGNGSILKLHAVTPHPYLSIGGVEMEEGKRVLKEFYERGNMSIPEDQRHRKKLKKD